MHGTASPIRLQNKSHQLSDPLTDVDRKCIKFNNDKWVTSILNAVRTARGMRSVRRSYSVLAATIRRLSALRLRLLAGDRGRTSGEVRSLGGRYSIETAAVACAGAVWWRRRVTASMVGTDCWINTVRAAAVRRLAARNCQQPTNNLMRLQTSQHGQKEAELGLLYAKWLNIL